MRRVKGFGRRQCAMAKHGDHPDLPELIEGLLEDDVHTVFLKADCPPRVKRGTMRGANASIEARVTEKKREVEYASQIYHQEWHQRSPEVSR